MHEESQLRRGVSVSTPFTGSGPRILSLSSVYPNPLEPGLGVFVKARLQHVAKGSELRVIAPVPLVDYSNPQGRWITWRRLFPLERRDGVTVLHPRWLYPPFGTPFNVVCMFLRLLPLLGWIRKTYRFEVIDAHFGYPEGVVACLLARATGVPFLVTMRGSELVFAKRPLVRLCLRWALQRAARVIVVSEALRELAIELGVPRERTRKIPNGIDNSIFRPLDRGACRAKYGINNERKVIVSAGELIEAKGHHLVIEALHRLGSRGADVDLWIAGGTARGGARFEETIGNLIRDLGMESRVHLAGWLRREELAELINAADLLCLASRVEGWPNVVHEALSCGTPVVATNVGAVPEMIPRDEFGRILPLTEIEVLPSFLDEALRTSWDRRKIALWGASRGWDEVAREVLAEIHTVLREDAQGTRLPGITRRVPLA